MARRRSGTAAEGGAVHCWMVGNRANRKAPLIPRDAVAVTGGYMHVCALVRPPGAKGRVLCFGEATNGKLGSTQPGPGPVTVDRAPEDEPVAVNGAAQEQAGGGAAQVRGDVDAIETIASRRTQ